MKKWSETDHKSQTRFGGLRRSELMSRIRSKGNETTEKLLVRLLRQASLVGWRRHADVLGRPDFVWRAERVAVFVDGCFWHGHDCRRLKPATNAREWTEKHRRNKKRDRTVSRTLRQQGWIVIRIWECRLKKGGFRCIRRIEAALRGRKP